MFSKHPAKFLQLTMGGKTGAQRQANSIYDSIKTISRGKDTEVSKNVIHSKRLQVAFDMII